MSNKVEVTIDTIVHATEDINKFYKSFDEIFGIKQEELTIQELTGHYNNPIMMINAKITKENAIKIIEKLSSKLSNVEKRDILESLNERMDDSSLYIRLDKQEFVQGQIILQDGNSIKLKIYTPVYKKKEIIQAYQSLLGFN